MAAPKGKRAAQRRVDQIHSFRRELRQLGDEGALALTPEQRDRLDAHLDGTLRILSEQFDVDTSDSQKQISLGMRIASALGGLAFCAAVFLFFYRYWGVVAPSVQVAILVGAPIASLIAIDILSRKERAQYYTALVAVVACGCFVLNLSVLAETFNMQPSPQAFLAWGLFGIVAAYTYHLKLPLVAGLFSLAVYVAAILVILNGAYWAEFIGRPEGFLVAGMLMLAVPAVVRHREEAEFPAMYRIAGLLAVFIALFALQLEGELSYLTAWPHHVEAFYQITGFIVAGLGIWLGIRNRLQAAVNLGAVFFSVYLIVRLSRWWWDWLPKYIFFLLMGCIALVLLFVIDRLRRRVAEA